MKNVGSVDRILRILIGCLLLSQIFIGLKTIWGLLGLILIATSLFSFCPLFAILKINSISKNQD